MQAAFFLTKEKLLFQKSQRGVPPVIYTFVLNLNLNLSLNLVLSLVLSLILYLAYLSLLLPLLTPSLFSAREARTFSACKEVKFCYVICCQLSAFLYAHPYNSTKNCKSQYDSYNLL